MALVVGGLRLRTIEAGPTDGGLLPLLVIPGHTARLEGYEDLIGPLAEHRRVIAVEMPGCGRSDKPVRRYDLRFYEDTLLGALDALGIDRAIPVGGSLGGNLTLRLGHRAPERFPALVVWAPGGAWTAKPALAAASRRLGRLAFWPSVAVQSRFWYDRDFEGRDRELAGTFAYYRREMCPGFVRMYWGMAADQLAHSLFDIAADVAQPTLLMWGDRDHGARMGHGVARLAATLPDRRFVVFPGRRHSLEAEIPDELAATILRFLAEVP